jgi:hypothetical protein
MRRGISLFLSAQLTGARLMFAAERDDERLSRRSRRPGPTHRAK